MSCQAQKFHGIWILRKREKKWLKLSFVDYDELIDRFIHAIFNTNNQLIVVIVV